MESTGDGTAAAPASTVVYESFSKDSLIEILRRFRHEHPSSVEPMDAIARTIHVPATNPPHTPIPRGSGEPSKKKQKMDKKAQKPFDFSRYRTRHVALKFSYMGEKYAGFARQDHMEETIERYMIDALTISRLVENFATCGYSRCGRTDAGVSALGQVIGLVLRSNVPADGTLLDGKTIDDIHAGDTFRVEMPDGTIKTLVELDYPTCLNSALPHDIRVYAWAPAPPEWSARFLCQGRTYRYFFHRRSLDLDAMASAAQLLQGKHDYRNFCRMDPTVTNFEREILSFQVHQVHGRAFLWHQVRCMAAILFLVGKGHESPEIVSTLLDIDACPRKPQYEMAPDLPLVLHDCAFASIDLRFMPGAVNRVYHDVENQWEAANLRAALLRNQLDTLKKLPVQPHRAIVELQRRQTPQTAAHIAAFNAYDVDAHVEFGEILHRLPAAGKGLKHIPLLQRKCGFSFEEKMNKVKRKAAMKKLAADADNEVA
ncbi:tRNA pseudouridine(38-40) synthase, variant [Aphanomyces invadans]|uniref:tRNA pseudouridine synthase n=1 Tax=Aphanomyces invadans TaxID=157072 RepID=A0A024TGS2_9STRA|nr:tRNA pseudouridine(38-40) synthase, variant [Aphanomyces invadans]ETV92781.1 tRNA pseudouridine(38-40) synthase, variant [Aphanomyces invadans]|eukprot:XP_008878550.1 tRNA pseudouridine(38-40) synthase, variant [Aphanomyces invadans]